MLPVSRPVTRLRLLLPDGSSSRGAEGRSHGRVPDAVDVIARAMADALATMGVQTRLQVQGAPSDGSPRSDVALWMPDLNGVTQPPDPKLAPARVHVALVVDPTSSPRSLARYDALLVPFEKMLPAVREAAQKSSRPPAVVHARLCGSSPFSAAPAVNGRPGSPQQGREAERVERGFSGKRVVAVDVRPGSLLGNDLERCVVQLALSASTNSSEAALVLTAGADDVVHKRLRDLCARHAVDVWLATGPDSLSSTLGTADVVVGAPSWDEILLCALHKTPLALVPPSSGSAPPFSSALAAANVVDDVIGTLQLAAAIDRRLFDAPPQGGGAAEARGLALYEALFASEKGLYDALAAVEPLPGTHAPSSKWEPIGPHAARGFGGAPATPTTVAAVDPQKPPLVSPAQKIEDDLQALKARLRAGA